MLRCTHLYKLAVSVSRNVALTGVTTFAATGCLSKLEELSNHQKAEKKTQASQQKYDFSKHTISHRPG